MATGLLVAAAGAVDARAEDVEAIFFLYLNEVEAGELYAVTRGTDVLVERSALEAAGLRGFAANEVQVGGRALISLASVRPRLRFTVDEEEVALRLHAPAELFPPQYFDLSGAPPEISYVSRPSAFLNYAPRLGLPSAGEATGRLFLEVGIAEANRLYYSGLLGSVESGVRRGLTNVNFDDRARLRRLTLGDNSVATGPLGGAAVLGGVTFARDFALDPYYVRHPRMRFASSTELPSTVDVFVNGIRVRSETLQPGTFTLDNVRGLAGAGNVRYVVRDALGREQAHFEPYYIGPEVLAKGTEDYVVSAGLPRSDLGTESFSYLGPSLLSFYRRGLSDAFTLGLRGEASWELLSGGTSLSTASDLGALELEAAASVADDGRAGAAALLAYEYQSRRYNAGASLRLLTHHYATISLSPDADRSVAQGVFSLAVPLHRRILFAARHTLDLRRDAPTYARVGAFTQIGLAQGFSLTAQLALVTLAPPQSSWDGFIGLSWSQRSGFVSNLGARTYRGVTGANLQVHRSAREEEDWSLAGAVDVAQSTRASLQSHLRTGAASLATYFDQRPGYANLAIEPAGSVVWVQGGGVFLTRPIYDGLALVRVPGVEGVRVSVNGRQVGRTNHDGYLLAPALVSHFGSQLAIATEDVPLDYELAEERVVAAPPRRGAAYVEFPAHKMRYFRGRLRLLKAGVEVDPAFGELLVDDGEQVLSSAIGREGVFELEGLRPGRYSAEVLVGAERCRFLLEIMDEGWEPDALLIDLGERTCETD